jgi:hypothetical protein
LEVGGSIVAALDVRVAIAAAFEVEVITQGAAAFTLGGAAGIDDGLAAEGGGAAGVDDGLAAEGGGAAGIDDGLAAGGGGAGMDLADGPALLYGPAPTTAMLLLTDVISHV